MNGNEQGLYPVIRCIVCGGEGYHKPFCSAKHFQGVVTAANAQGPAGIFIKDIRAPEEEIQRLHGQRIRHNLRVVFDPDGQGVSCNCSGCDWDRSYSLNDEFKYLRDSWEEHLVLKGAPIEAH